DRASPDRRAAAGTALAAGGAARPPVGALGALQRSAGNRAVSGLLTAAPRPEAAVQRTALTDGPPLAPGHYRYGDVIVSLDERGMRTTLRDMAAAKGLEAEREWQQRFVTDMRAVSRPRSYDDPATRQ
ncbi:hypothetical protein G3V86_24920, partial [Escherichia coli]|nr:hypothetical protein [Escherichia coli]